MTDEPTLTGAPWTAEPGAIVFLDDAPVGYTEDEAYAILGGDYSIITKLRDQPIIASAAFHLAGKHNQKSHGHGGQGELEQVSGRDLKKARKSYDSAVSKADASRDATRHVPLGMGAGSATVDGVSNDGVSTALSAYTGSDKSYDINSALRAASGHLDSASVPSGSSFHSTEEMHSVIRTMDAGMAASHTSSDVVTMRAVDAKAFAGRLHPGVDNSGLTWREHGFVSTTTSVETRQLHQHIIHQKSGDYSPPPTLVMNIHIPKGSHALRGSPYEHEIIIDRGSTFRIIHDHGIKPGDINKEWHVDVELIQ